MARRPHSVLSQLEILCHLFLLPFAVCVSYLYMPVPEYIYYRLYIYLYFFWARRAF